MSQVADGVFAGPLSVTVAGWGIHPTDPISGDSDSVPPSATSLYNIWLLPCTRSPVLRVIKFTIYNVGRPLLGHHNYTLSLHGPRPGVETKHV